MQSPFFTHRNKVLGHYSTAAWLRRVVMAMWNGADNKVGLSSMAMLDDEHYMVFAEMVEHYRSHGESDPAFLALVGDVRKRLEYEAEAAMRSERLDDWCHDAKNALRAAGLDADTVDDNYDWFTGKFDAGMTPSEAVAAFALIAS